MALPRQPVTGVDKPPTRQEKSQDDTSKNQIFHFKTPLGFSRGLKPSSHLHFNASRIISLSKSPGRLSRNSQFLAGPDLPLPMRSKSSLSA
jgi:hypothetical protein